MTNNFLIITKVVEILNKKYPSNLISIDDVLVTAIQSNLKISLYALPTKHRICWSFNREHTPCRERTCDPSECSFERIQNKYLKISANYLDRLRNSEPTPMQYMYDPGTNKEGLLFQGPNLTNLSGMIPTPYTLKHCDIFIRDEDVKLLEAALMTECQEHFQSTKKYWTTDSAAKKHADLWSLIDTLKENNKEVKTASEPFLSKLKKLVKEDHDGKYPAKGYSDPTLKDSIQKYFKEN